MKLLIELIKLFFKSKGKIEFVQKYDGITLEEYLTASGKYPERSTHPECNQEVRQNASTLLDSVNAILKELSVSGVVVSSGFRPSAVNASLPNSAKKSLHMTGKAVDIEDIDGVLYQIIANRPDLLKKYGLWLENGDYTKGWVHLDNSTSRRDREIQIFIP